MLGLAGLAPPARPGCAPAGTPMATRRRRSSCSASLMRQFGSELGFSPASRTGGSGPDGVVVRGVPLVHDSLRGRFFQGAIRMFQRDNEMRNIVLTDATAWEKATSHFFGRALREAREPGVTEL